MPFLIFLRDVKGKMRVAYICSFIFTEHCYEKNSLPDDFVSCLYHIHWAGSATQE